MPSQKIALVTGANRGIGKEIACQLSETGFRLIVAARDLARANAVVQDLKNESFAIGLDVSNEDSVKMAATEVAKKVDHLDVLVNNAGVIGNHDMLDFDMKEIYHCDENQLLRTHAYQ